jgi:hypothetical protein
MPRTLRLSSLTARALLMTVVAGALASSLALGCTGCTSTPSSSRKPNPPAQQSNAHKATPPKMAQGASSAAPPAVPAEPEEPPYDLAADQKSRAKTAKEELGARTITTVVSDIFVVICPPGWQGDACNSSVALMKSSMAGYMNGRFTKKPQRAISVYLFAEGTAYESFCHKKYDAACIAHYGFYQPADRYMVMNAGLGLGTLTHEIVHPLYEADFPGGPTWLNEGIASVFEAPSIPRTGEIHGVKNWRHPRIKRALLSTTERDKARLDALFGMSDTFFRGKDEDLHYAQARYFAQWMDDHGKLWPFYHRWRDNHADDPTGEKSFKETMGMTPAEAHDAWAKWVIGL